MFTVADQIDLAHLRDNAALLSRQIVELDLKIWKLPRRRDKKLAQLSGVRARIKELERKR